MCRKKIFFEFMKIEKIFMTSEAHLLLKNEQKKHCRIYFLYREIMAAELNFITKISNGWSTFIQQNHDNLTSEQESGAINSQNGPV